MKSKYLDETPLDDYEKELKAFLDKGEFVSDPNFEQTKKDLQKAAERYLEKETTQSVTVRVKKNELNRLKVRARQKSIPYQTIINLLISQYNRGETKIVL